MARRVLNEAVWVALVLATIVALIDQATTGSSLWVCPSPFHSQMACVGWFRHTLGNVTLSGQVPLSANGGNIRHPLAVAQLAARPDFSLSASPFLQTTTPGNSATYNVAVAPVISTSGFYRDILLSVTGLPPGAASTFSPASVQGSGSSTLSISISNTTPADNYRLTITARTGDVIHVTQVTLIVTDFSMSVSPTSRSVRRGVATSYTITITPVGSLVATIKFSLSGLPPRAISSFTPRLVSNAGASMLTIQPQTKAPVGTYSLTVTATGAGVKHCTTAILIIQ